MKPHRILLFALAAALFACAVWAQDAPATDARPPSRDPFAEDWLEAGYKIDSREDQRDLIFEGHSKVSDYVDVWGQLDLYSSLSHDPSRFELRSGVFGRAHQTVGGVLWYEEFTGSSNQTLRAGLYGDVSAGGPDPFCRLMALPVATEDGGYMARAMFDVALRPKWSLAGWYETAWHTDAGSWNACEPSLRYEFQKGLWGTLEYRRDERWDEVEGVAVGLRAAL